MSIETTTGPVTQLLDAAMETWGITFRAGARIQEESARQLRKLLIHFGSPREWQEQAPTTFKDAIHIAEKNLEEATRVINENAQRNSALLQKAIESGQVEGGEDAAKVREVWEATLSTIRENTQAVVQANTRMLASWAEWGKGLGETMTSGRA